MLLVKFLVRNLRNKFHKSFVYYLLFIYLLIVSLKKAGEGIQMVPASSCSFP